MTTTTATTPVSALQVLITENTRSTMEQNAANAV